MLVLSRKSHEAIVVGGSTSFSSVLRITVIDVRDGTVRLGIEAEADVPIHRAEIWGRVFPNEPQGPTTRRRSNDRVTNDDSAFWKGT
jgi:carbon storage regulator